MKTFAQHLQELLTRLSRCLVVVALGSVVGFLIHKPIEVILQKPLGQTLYYSNPAGGMTFVMQIALGVGLLLALPVILYQLMQFARPAIKPVRSRNLAILVVSATILTVLAVAYAYWISLPAALHFLVSFNSSNIKALISISDYLKFLFAYLSGTVLAFQLPLILFFANKIKRFPPGSLTNMQRPVIAGAVIFAGAVTPTVDPVNQLLVALPIIALFQVGALAVVLTNRRHRQQPKFEIKMPAKLVPLTVPLEEALPTTFRPVTEFGQPALTKRMSFAAESIMQPRPVLQSRPIAQPQTRVQPVARPSRPARLVVDGMLTAY